jgi:hypothetical protein
VVRITVAKASSPSRGLVAECRAEIAPRRKMSATKVSFYAF